MGKAGSNPLELSRPHRPIHVWRGVPGSTPILVAAGASVGVGALAVVAPMAAVGMFASLAGIALAWTRPALTVSLCLIASCIHRGVFLYLRVEPGGFPISVFDGLPFLVLLASASLATKSSERTVPRVFVVASVAMLAVGLAVGVILGFSQDADAYELVRVVRLEVLVIVGLLSVLVAGHLAAWRRAVVSGLVVGAALVALQLLITFWWSLVTGEYFWSLFPFGRVSESSLEANVQTGNIGALRENAISGFLILPALALLVVRLRGRDTALLMLLVAGGLVWLSRGLWAAMFATIVLAALHRRSSRHFGGGRLLAIALPLGLVVAIAFSASGGILGQRLGETTNLTGDESLAARATESTVNVTALTDGPLPLFAGIGTGVVASPLGQSAILENSVLGIWTNTGLLGLLGVSLLFFCGAARGWILVRDERPDVAALGAMAVALPVLWLQGLVGGVFSIEQSAVWLCLLAATVIVTPAAPVPVPYARAAHP